MEPAGAAFQFKPPAAPGIGPWSFQQPGSSQPPAFAPAPEPQIDKRGREGDEEIDPKARSAAAPSTPLTPLLATHTFYMTIPPLCLDLCNYGFPVEQAQMHRTFVHRGLINLMRNMKDMDEAQIRHQTVGMLMQSLTLAGNFVRAKLANQELLNFCEGLKQQLTQWSMSDSSAMNEALITNSQELRDRLKAELAIVQFLETVPGICQNLYQLIGTPEECAELSGALTNWSSTSLPSQPVELRIRQFSQLILSPIFLHVAQKLQDHSMKYFADRCIELGQKSANLQLNPLTTVQERSIPFDVLDGMRCFYAQLEQQRKGSDPR